jgi:hypothetical protein
MDVSDEHVVSIFRFEELTEQETNVKASCRQSFSAVFLYGVFFYPEDGGYMFL